MHDLSPAMRLETASDQRVVHPHQFERRAVAKPRRNLGRTNDVGEHYGAQPRIHRPRGGGWGCARVADATEERLNRGKIDRNDDASDFAMCLTTDSLGGGRIWRINKAEAGATLLVEPVSHILDPVPTLDLEVLAVRVNDIHLLQASHVVAIHENRQEVFLVRRRDSSGCRSDAEVHPKQVARVEFYSRSEELVRQRTFLPLSSRGGRENWKKYLSLAAAGAKA